MLKLVFELTDERPQDILVNEPLNALIMLMIKPLLCQFFPKSNCLIPRNIEESLLYGVADQS